MRRRGGVCGSNKIIRAKIKDRTAALYALDGSSFGSKSMDWHCREVHCKAGEKDKACVSSSG